MNEPTMLDVGTGSGCIAVTVAHQHKTARVTAVDVSPDALSVATRNAERHKLTERVRFLPGDLFAALPLGETFDFILSNPPYITHAEMALLPASVREHEPRLALDGGEDGFTVLTRLIAEARDRLKPGGYLLVIGTSQDEARGNGWRRLAMRSARPCSTAADGRVSSSVGGRSSRSASPFRSTAASARSDAPHRRWTAEDSGGGEG
jgi:methylase of polypeptide subunit release factors